MSNNSEASETSAVNAPPSPPPPVFRRGLREEWLRVNGLRAAFVGRREALKLPPWSLPGKEPLQQAYREVCELFAAGVAPGEILGRLQARDRENPPPAIEARMREKARVGAQWRKVLDAVGDREAGEAKNIQWVGQHIGDEPSQITLDKVPSRAAVHMLMWCQESPDNARQFILQKYGRVKAGSDGEADDKRGRVKTGGDDTSALDDYLAEVGHGGSPGD
jgi:hypothetical protein